MAKLNMRLILGWNALKCSMKVDFTTSTYLGDSISLAVEPENLHPRHHQMREQEMTTSGRIEVVLRTERTLPAGSADALVALLK